MPEPGFYYHFKHDPSAGSTHHAYEVTGIAWHTEDESYLVAYRPLYDASFLGEATFVVRPLDMFMGTVERDGKTVLRFTRVTDPEVVRQLEAVRDTMYPH